MHFERLWRATYQADYTVRESERDAYRDLDAGVVGAFRNPSAHQFVDPTPHEGGALIANLRDRAEEAAEANYRLVRQTMKIARDSPPPPPNLVPRIQDIYNAYPVKVGRPDAFKAHNQGNEEIRSRFSA